MAPKPRKPRNAGIAKKEASKPKQAVPNIYTDPLLYGPVTKKRRKVRKKAPPKYPWA